MTLVDEDFKRDDEWRSRARDAKSRTRSDKPKVREMHKHRIVAGRQGAENHAA